MFRAKPIIEHTALSATPVKIDLSGRWTVRDQDGKAGRFYNVTLEQYGTAIFGTMRSTDPKSNQVIHIRGIIVDDRLVANTWVSQPEGLGSGMIDLVPNEEATILAGTCSWYTVLGSQEYRNTVWKKIAC